MSSRRFSSSIGSRGDDTTPTTAEAPILPPMRQFTAVLALLIAGASVGTPSPRAQSAPDTAWRQWGGPHRNFMVETTGLADTWPDTGPRVLWKRPLGPGHS